MSKDQVWDKIERYEATERELWIARERFAETGAEEDGQKVVALFWRLMVETSDAFKAAYEAKVLSWHGYCLLMQTEVIERCTKKADR